MCPPIRLTEAYCTARPLDSAGKFRTIPPEPPPLPIAVPPSPARMLIMTMRIATTSPFEGLEEAVAENVPLAPYTWYKIGGPARYFVRPRTVEELQEASRRCIESQIPIYVLGLGANLLVGDAGGDGAVFRFDQEYWRRW